MVRKVPDLPSPPLQWTTRRAGPPTAHACTAETNLDSSYGPLGCVCVCEGGGIKVWDTVKQGFFSFVCEPNQYR